MKTKLEEIRAALGKMAATEKNDGGLAKELSGVVLGLAESSEHAAEVIAADLDGKEDVLKGLSERAWSFAREHKQNNSYYMSGETAMKLAAEYFALPVPETEKAPAAAPEKAEKKILSLEDLL